MGKGSVSGHPFVVVYVPRGVKGSLAARTKKRGVTGQKKNVNLKQKGTPGKNTRRMPICWGGTA